MAIDDAYATAAEYRARTNKSDATDDATILAQLKSVSRWIEHYTGRIFNQSAGATARYFDGDGGERLFVADLVSIDSSGLKVDEDYDGTYELTVLSTNYFLRPYNAAEIAEPYTSIELAQYSSNSQLSAFPSALRNVKITGTWGFPAVPASVKEAAVAIARGIRDMEEAGFTLTLENVDAAIALSPRIPTICRDLLDRYRLERMVFI